MAGFCGSCGFPVGENGAFCPRCGTRQAMAGAGAPPQPAAPAVSTAASGSGFKILVIVLVCLGVAGATGIGGLWYLAHRVKEAVVEKAQESGVDLHSIVPPAAATTNRHKVHKACDLLSKEEAARILGEPIERAEYQQESCNYYGPPGLSAKLAQDQAADIFKRTQAPGAKPGGMEVANGVGALIDSLGAAAGQTGSGGEMPLLMLVVSDENARSVMAAQNASNALFSGIFKAAEPDAKGAQFGAQIQGLGDQAVRVPKLGLNVLQGDTMIRIIAGPVPDADAKSIDLARLVLKRL
jgi:hypothetical protein